MLFLRRCDMTLRVVLVLIPFAFLGGMFADRIAMAAGSTRMYRQLDLFGQVLSYIENNYVEKVDEKQLVQGAIQGMVATLDPHTSYMPPEVFKEIKIDTSGEFGGVGLELSLNQAISNGVRTQSLVVVATIDDTPAARAGIRVGDTIVKIDGEYCADMDLNTAVSLMRGPTGSRVILTLFRQGFSKPRDIVVIRDRIQMVSVEGRLIDGFGYVKLKSFQENTDRHLKRTLDGLRKQNKSELKGLVLDLRNNPGGLLDQAVKVSDRFLTKGLLIVTTKGRNGRIIEEEKSHERETEPNYPLIILVNGSSASASEIVAGALQDHKRAVIMGQATFGKGSVQTLIELEDGSGLKLTIAKYFTPKDRSIQETGIPPDVEITEGADKVTREIDLKNHFKNESNNILKAKATQFTEGSKKQKNKLPLEVSNAQPGNGGSSEDFVLNTAIGYLRTWSVFRKNTFPMKVTWK